MKTISRRVPHAALALASILCANPSPSIADTLTIDDTVAGTVYDGTIDGFPIPPPGLPQDGEADLTGNPLGVALRTGVTEQRGIIEFPLGTLAGIAAGDVVSATLSFNIDDVVSTFGPGTTFDGTAADTFFLFDYAGNGAIDLNDFENVAGAPLAIVATTAHGVITDSSLASSGPIVFDVDVTGALVDHLIGADGYMGVVIATDDNQSATSLDNLGNSGAGPAGVNGSFMPFLTIVTDAGDPPVFSKDEFKCQKAIATAGGKYLKTVFGSLTKCMDHLLAATAAGGDLAKATEKCQSSADLGSQTSKVGKGVLGTLASITGACAGLNPSALNHPCSESLGTFQQVAACIITEYGEHAALAARSAYADACALLTAAGLDTDYPAVCAD